jgi:periplasmic copper chaperone A
MSQLVSSPFLARAGAAALAAATLTLVVGTAAQAHVQVIPDQTAAGTEITKLTFRVPTESESAGTSKVSIGLPTDTPLAEVLAEPIDGWTISIKDAKLPKPVVLDGTTLTEAPSTVTWTATKGHQVGPGQFQEFSLSAGPIPDDAKTLSFPTTQTYSDGTVVKWNQPQAPGADEPEHPLPSFAVTAAEPDEDAAADPTPTAEAATAPAKAATVESTSASTSVDSTTRGLAIGGLVAGLLGLVIGALAWRRGASAA